MKTTETVKQVVEFRLEEVLQKLIPAQTPTVDFDESIMRTKDGGSILVLELTTRRVHT